MSRRKLAADLGFPDTTAGIPEARWMRAMTFERLVRDERFVSPLLTTAVGALGLSRPKGVWPCDGKVNVAQTAKMLQEAHLKAVHEDVATLITSLAVPFVGLEGDDSATPVKPDFAVVAPRRDASADKIIGSWLIMGDAKDYERVRSRIGDQRMLKGFLQVALGAESVAAWSAVPSGMIVHSYGVLAVPRNAFLQPEAVIERLDDHRAEVLARVRERVQLMANRAGEPVEESELAAFIRHLEAEFDPTSCAACAMFNYCRSELRASSEPAAVLVELGIRKEARAALRGLVDGTGDVGRVPGSLVANVRATVEGLPQSTGQRRIDAGGVAGTINVVLAKSDAAALGVHGIGVQRVRKSGKPTTWAYKVFADPQSPATRLAIMQRLGAALAAAMRELEDLTPGAPSPTHVVVPDQVTADVLVSIADSLAGVETSRLRWQRDIEMGRPPLTFNGEPASVPKPLTEKQRLAVSFLLEEDRARAMTLRSPIVNLREVMARHVIAGGPAVDSGRLDYLVTWATAVKPLEHRAISDAIIETDHTPGARLSNARSDAIHTARRRASQGSATDGDLYEQLVGDELSYKAKVVDSALAFLDALDDSRLREVYRAIEGDAQYIWRRRLRLHASDLVRFGRTNWVWRNDQVTMLDTDVECRTKLEALGNPQIARDLASDAGTRQVALATVLAVEPIRLAVDSRRIRDGSYAVALHINSEPCVEAPTTTLKIQGGSFKFGMLSLGLLTADDETEAGNGLLWEPREVPVVSAGDVLVIADAAWFGKLLTSRREINVARPGRDTTSAPKKNCHEGAYAEDPESHKYCCRPHESAEADISDWLAERRAAGELNPQAWPPVIDSDGFDTPARGAPTDATIDGAEAPPVADLTIDDLD